MHNPEMLAKPKIFIVESDTPTIVEELSISGRTSSAGCYERSFQAISSLIQTQTILPYADGFEPASVDFAAYDGCVFTGAHVPWGVDAPEALPLRQTIEAVFNATLPTFGSCNGLQLGAVVLGGKCTTPSSGMEVGLAREITLSPAGQSHPLHHGRSQPFAALSLHRDQVSKVPDGAIVTASNSHSPVQAMVYEQGGVRFWGTQYHPEYTLQEILDCVSDKSSLFYCEKTKRANLQAANQNPAGEAAQKLGARGDDLQPHVRHTELVNWLHSLSDNIKTP